jgi:hypothetical protein
VAGLALTFTTVLADEIKTEERFEFTSLAGNAPRPKIGDAVFVSKSVSGFEVISVDGIARYSRFLDSDAIIADACSTTNEWICERLGGFAVPRTGIIKVGDAWTFEGRSYFVREEVELTLWGQRIRAFVILQKNAQASGQEYDATQKEMLVNYYSRENGLVAYLGIGASGRSSSPVWFATRLPGFGAIKK